MVLLYSVFRVPLFFRVSLVTFLFRGREDVSCFFNFGSELLHKIQGAAREGGGKDEGGVSADIRQNPKKQENHSLRPALELPWPGLTQASLFLPPPVRREREKGKK